VTAPAGWLSAVGERVRSLRTERGLSQRALAQAAGVHYKSVGKVEAGRSGVQLDTLWRVADGLGVYLADLLGEPTDSRLPGPPSGPAGAGS
jgi:transcriptional regulator with XRE-family HTH domain